MLLRASRLVSCLALSGALWSGCSTPPTEVVVRVDSNVPTTAHGGPLESVTVRVEYEATHATIFERRVVFGGTEVVPGDVGIVAGASNESRALHVVVTAAFTGSAPVVREFILRFVPERTVLLDAWIDGGCRALTNACAAGTTCGRDARCEPVLNPPLLPFTPLRLDAGAARMDVGADVPRDASRDVAVDVSLDAMEAAVADADDAGQDAARVDLGRPETTVVDALTDATSLDVPALDAIALDVARADATGTDAPADVSVVPLAAPRLIWPPSTSTVTSNRPTLEWSPVVGATAYEVQFSQSREFTSFTMFTASSTHAQVPIQSSFRLSNVFWRVVARRPDASLASPPSPVWQCYLPILPTRTVEVDTAWGSIPDFNGDGFPELAVGAPGAPQPCVTVFHGTRGGPPGSGTSGYTLLTGPSSTGRGYFGGAVASAGT